MKGKTTIQFFDENGKKLSERIEYNKITEAVNNIVNPNFIVNGITNNGGEVVNTYTPIWKNFAGLQLFADSIDENVIIPGKHEFSKFTGNGADANHYDSTNVYHGYFDAANSEITAEKLKLQYIFPLNSVAGTIASICLSSIQGGNNGLVNGTESLFLSYSNQDLQNGQYVGVGIDTPSANYIPYCIDGNDGLMVGINDDGQLVTLKAVDTTHISIKLYSINTKVNFTDSFYRINSLADFQSVYGGLLENLPMLNIESEAEIELINGFDDISKSTLVGNYIYIPKNTNGVFTNYRIDLNNDFEVKYQINTTTNIANIVDYKNNGNKLYITTTNYLYIVNLGDYDNSTHEITFDRLELVENDLVPVVWKDTVCLLNTKNIAANDVRNIYYLTDTNVLNRNTLKFNNACDEIINFCFNFNEPIFGIITKTGTTSTINTNIFTAYLATINNISPAVKYSTVAMKIIYEIYSDDYEE